MGEVFLAEDTKLGRRVAIKFLTDECAKNAADLQRFDQEAKAASSLNHPNILVIHEIGETDRGHYIVSEFVEGETLREIVDKKKLTIPEILDILIQTVGALSAAHAANIVHRDIKPENIMVRPDGYVKVLDFGLAKLISNPTTALEDATMKQDTTKGLIIGTVSYMSPEQARAMKMDERTDIFSLGVVMYEMITGQTPFAGNSLAESFANLIEREPLPLANFSESVSSDLQRVVGKMLRKERNERYQTMKGLLADLKELRGNGSREEKPIPGALPDHERITAIYEAPTANIKNVTNDSHPVAPSRKFSAKRLSLFSVLAAILLSGLVYGWYWRQASNSTTAIKSLAVLPLKSLDAGENYLGLGIADAVIRRMSQTGELTVRPTSAVRRYVSDDVDALTAAGQLNADAVLDGSFQRANDRLRVSVNLLRVSDGVSLWADSFDMSMSDVFTIQDTVAQQVSSRLRLRLDASQQAQLTKRYTSNLAANEFYMKGIYSLDQRMSIGKEQRTATIDLFKQAIDADPDFALAHAQLAFAYALAAVFYEPTEPTWAERAQQEIDKAQSLDPQLAETRLARHQLLCSMYEGFQCEAAVRELLAAQQLNPNIGHAELGFLYYHLGLEDLAARELQRALDIDPTSEFVKRQILSLYMVGGKYDELLSASQKYFPHEPVDSFYFLGKGRLDEAQAAIDEMQKAVDEKRASPFSVSELPPRKALLYALRGDFRSAEAEIPIILSMHPVKDPFYHHAAYNIACVFAIEGKSSEAVKWLKETAASGFQPYPTFERDAFLDKIRQAPEFVQFMTEMKQKNDEYRREFQ